MSTPRILFIPSWYANRQNPICGIFIEKHAQAISLYSEVVWLTIDVDDNITGYDLSITKEKERFYRVAVRFGRRSSIAFYSKFQQVKALRLALAAIKKQIGKLDLVHLNVADLKYVYFTWLACFLLKIPYMITEHASRHIYSDCKPSLPEKIAFHKARVVTAVSQFLLDNLRRKKCLPYRFCVTANTIDIPQKTCIRPKSGAKIKILVIGMLIPVKNIMGLLDAFLELVKKDNRAELHIIGDGEQRAFLEKQACSCLNNSIFFHGFVANDQLESYFAHCHFFVLNSIVETFSVVVVEALLHGLPVVVTKCGGPQEFVDKTTGILVEKENKENLLAGLRFMMEHWQEYSPESLKKSVAKRFSYDTIGKKFHKVYLNIMNKEKA